VNPDQVNIYSGVDPHTGAAVCVLEWGPIHTALQPDVVMATARDLQTAAARAETDIALIRVLRSRVGMSWDAVGAMLRNVRSERPMLPGKPALRIDAVAGAGTGMAYVHISRGSMKGSMAPDEAREMATNWIETAVAAHTDARLRYVLGEYPQLSPADRDGIFAGLRNAGGDQVTERTTPR
jgi:hypothetical protein